MISARIAILTLLFYSAWNPLSQALPQDVYIIFYATYNGYTGHVAIAIDNYDVTVLDSLHNGEKVFYFDTISNKSITYFDLWPGKDIDVLSAQDLNEDIPASYYRCPQAGKRLTLDQIYRKGLDHENLPPEFDGLIRIPTQPGDDFRLVEFYNKILEQRPPFNLRSFNCTDFVIKGIEEILGKKIEAREFIPFAFSNTPNQLYKTLKLVKNTEVLVDPRHRVDGSFMSERIFKHNNSKKDKLSNLN